MRHVAECVDSNARDGYIFRVYTVVITPRITRTTCQRCLGSDTGHIIQPYLPAATNVQVVGGVVVQRAADMPGNSSQ